MSTITLISIVILCLLIGAILLLIWQRQKGKTIPLAVIFVLGFFALGLGAIIGFVHKGEDYQAYQKTAMAHLSARANCASGCPRLYSVCRYHFRLVHHLPNQ